MTEDVDPLLVELRGKLKENDLVAYIIPPGDAHQSEYVAECDMRRAFISGFNGSAGTGVVTLNHALVWTDSRYFLQASKQLKKGWNLMKKGSPGVPKLTDWIGNNVKGNVGVDPTLYSIKGFISLSSKLKKAGKTTKVKLVESNLVDELWKNRPKRPANPIVVHPLQFSGVSVPLKLEKLYSQMTHRETDLMVVCALDEIAYILNLRGDDIKYNPVFYSYLTLRIGEEGRVSTLYVDKSQLTEGAIKHLNESGVTARSSQDLQSDLRSSKSERPWLDPSKTSVWIQQALSMRRVASEGKEKESEAKTSEAESENTETHAKNSEPLLEDSPIGLMKAVKNEKELEGIIMAHELDAAALCKFFSWIHAEIPGKPTDKKEKKEWNEWTLAEKLASFREKNKYYVGPSFSTISSFGENGAVIHYSPTEKSALPVDDSGLYLLDSGGQYQCGGTTDVTRTIHLGDPTSLEKRCYTRVLQGNIALSEAVFPEGTVGPKLDVLARGPLWRDGLQYRHGTGHGVGSYLNVHEGPHGISASSSNKGIETTALKSGMLVTNEPGYYLAGKFGIRIENMMVVRPFDPPKGEAFPKMEAKSQPKYLKFETICWAPLQSNLIDMELMSKYEISWVNSYHSECRRRLRPRLAGPEDKNALEWMLKATEPI
ncbi:hypothetical protein AAMO2058_000100600 [Amorphochlora amoebiformis]